MFALTIFAILALAAIILIVMGEYDDHALDKPVNLRAIGAVILVISLIPLAFSITSRVEAKQVGVLTTFGKPSAKTHDAGLVVHLPWQKVTQIDATTQTNEYHGDDAIKVILKDRNTAEVSATIRWAVNRENANDVYADFRTNDPTDSLRKAVVSTQFKAAVNSVFNSYDAAIEDPISTEELSKQVEDILGDKMLGLVDLKSVTISYIKPDKAVQRKIDALQTQRGATNVANEKIQTAEAEARANKILAESVSKDPNVLVSKCLDLIADGDFVPPAGFSCWPGGGTGVVIPSAN